MSHSESGALPALFVDHVRAPFAGRYAKGGLRSWSLVCGAWMVAAFVASDSGLSVLWAIAISLLALSLQVFVTSSRRLFLAPSFLVLIFATGYPLSFADLVTRWAELPQTGWGSVGHFAFTNEGMSRPFQIIVAGVIGIAVGIRLSESLWSRLRSRVVIRRSVRPGLVPLFVWAIACAVVVVVCATLGIGRVGLDNSSTLPFRLNGILVIGRQFFLPILGARLVQRALDSSGQERLVLTLLVVVAVAAAVSLGALSRSLGAFYLVPVMLFAVSYQDSLRRSLRRLGLCVAIVVVVLALVGVVVSVERTLAYSGDEWIGASEVASETSGESGLLAGIVGTFGELIGSRLGGVDGLLAVTSIQGWEPDPWIPIELILGDDAISEQIMMESFGFLPNTSGGLAFGVSFSLWGVLGLGSTILIPLLGSALLVVLICTIEGLFSWQGEEAMGATLGSLVAFTSWGGGSTFYLARIAVSVFVALLIALGSRRSLSAALARRASSDHESLAHDRISSSA